MITAPPSSRPASPRQLYPGWAVRIIVALALVVIVLSRALPRLEYPPWPFGDPAVCNLLTLIFSFVTVLTLWIWIAFFSGYSLPLRRTVFYAALAPIILFAPYVGV